MMDQRERFISHVTKLFFTFCLYISIDSWSRGTSSHGTRIQGIQNLGAHLYVPERKTQGILMTCTTTSGRGIH